jgi:hypothetical protein
VGSSHLAARTKRTGVDSFVQIEYSSSDESFFPKRSHTMDEQKKQHDSEAGLQEELRRESAEVSDAVGDIAENRNLSGSSTWTTQPEEKKDEPKED